MPVRVRPGTHGRRSPHQGAARGSRQPLADRVCAIPGDTRLLATTNASGFDRPVIWDVKTGDRTDLPLHDITGEVTSMGWSPDGSAILLMRFDQAVNALYVYDLDRSTLTRLNHPGGTISSAYFVPGT
ncbi:WD40 repeat domain-containing protein, partial [bacterium]|nr:WD40 repeat domain-containing protein [bacterium]